MLYSYKFYLLLCFSFIYAVLYFLKVDIGEWVGEHSGFSKWVVEFSSSNYDLYYSALSKVLPDTHANLIMGVSLGSDRIQSQRRFNDIMKISGMMHAIVASGYNINLMYNLVLRLLGSEYRFMNLFLAQIFALIYAFLAGFNIPIVRAIIMASVIKWHRFLGYKNSSFYILFFTALVILCISPSQISSLSFWYSFLATFGLLILGFVPATFTKHFPTVILETFFAQMFIFPLSYLIFGIVNFISFLSNVLLGSLIPLITLLGFINYFLVWLGISSIEFINIVLGVLASVFIYVCDSMGQITPVLSLYFSMFFDTYLKFVLSLI